MKGLCAILLVFFASTVVALGQNDDMGLLSGRKHSPFVRMNEWGFDVGAKLVTSYRPFLNWDGPSDYQTGTAQASYGIHDYLFRRKRCRFGLNLYTDGFNFLFERIMSTNLPLSNYRYIHEVDMRLNTRNVCFGPILDRVSGRHRHSHLYFSPVVGLRLYGTQQIHVIGSDISYSPSLQTSEYSNGTQGLYQWICEVNLGYGRSFRISKDWRLLINATFASIPDQMSLTHARDAHGITLNPGAVRLTVGLNKRGVVAGD